MSHQCLGILLLPVFRHVIVCCREPNRAVPSIPVSGNSKIILSYDLWFGLAPQESYNPNENKQIFSLM